MQRLGRNRVKVFLAIDSASSHARSVSSQIGSRRSGREVRARWRGGKKGRRDRGWYRVSASVLWTRPLHLHIEVPAESPKIDRVRTNSTSRSHEIPRGRYRSRGIDRRAASWERPCNAPRKKIFPSAEREESKLIFFRKREEKHPRNIKLIRSHLVYLTSSSEGGSFDLFRRA